MSTVPQSRTEHVPFGRHPFDILLLTVGITGMAVASWAATLSNPRLTSVETNLFRLINDLPATLEPVLTVVMQAGALAAVFVVAAATALSRRFRLALAALLGGTGAWTAARLLKGLVGRARPAGILDEVITRGTHAGLGFPSGHAATAAALATILAPYLPRPARRALWSVVFVVGIARIYVGAHLPLDAVGGWFLGLAAGSLINLLLGSPMVSITTDMVRKALGSAGYGAYAVMRLSSDARGSVPYLASPQSESGPTLFVKALSRDQRDADWLYKTVRHIRYRDIEDEEPFASAKQQAEHEAFVLWRAERAGVCVSGGVDVVSSPTGSAFLIQQQVNGVTLDRCPAERITDEVLRNVFRQVRALHAARIAHRDLRSANLIIGDDGSVTVVDFGFAEISASPHRLAIDVAEVLTATSLAAGPDRAIEAAVAVLDRADLENVLPVLQPAALSRATRALVQRDHPGLVGDIRIRLAAALGVPVPPEQRLVRVRLTGVLILLGAGFALHLLLPQLGEVDKAWNSLRSSDWVLVTYAALASAATYFAAGLAINASSPVPLPYDRCATIAVAGSFANRFAPGGLGRIGLVVSSINKAGAPLPAASSAPGLEAASGLVVHMTALLVLGAIYGRRLAIKFDHPSFRWFLVVATVIVVTAVVLFSLRRVRRAAVRTIRGAVGPLRAALSNPRRMVRLLSASALLNAFYIVCLDLSMRAVHTTIGSGEMALVYLGGAAVGAASPTPGGLGAEEVALVAGLVAAGSPTETAVAGVVLFRLLTYWVPIVPGGFAFAWLRRNHLS